MSNYQVYTIATQTKVYHKQGIVDFVIYNNALEEDFPISETIQRFNQKRFKYAVFDNIGGRLKGYYVRRRDARKHIRSR